MDISILFALLLLLVCGFALFVFFSREFKRDLSNTQNRVEDFVLNQNKALQQEVKFLSSEISDKLKDQNSVLNLTQKTVGERLEGANKVVSEVQHRLGRLEAASQKIFDLGQDIKDLEHTLKAPKLRGVWSELYLEEILEQMIPKAHFKMQYTFKSGKTVDAVIQLQDGLIPVDAKFPLENFKKITLAETDTLKKQTKTLFANNVKKHIDDIHDKYILPNENTFDFAMMYIPSESIYYELSTGRDEFLRDKEIFEYARKKNVIPVSPNTFYSYLQTIMLGLKGLTIEQSAKEVLEQLSRLKHDFDRFKGDFKLLGTHIKNVKQTQEKCEKSLGRFEDELLQVEKESDEPQALESLNLDSENAEKEKYEKIG